MADVKVTTNIADFRRQLRALDARMQATYVAAGVRAIGRVIGRQARANVRAGHTITGTLARAIFWGARRRPSRGLVTGFVAARSGAKERARVAKGKTNRDAYYWPWVEGGHRIVPRGGSLSRGGGRTIRALKRSRFDKGGGKRTKPVEFLLRAFRSTQGAAIQAFDRAVSAGLEKESARKT